MVLVGNIAFGLIQNKRYTMVLRSYWITMMLYLGKTFPTQDSSAYSAYISFMVTVGFALGVVVTIEQHRNM